MEQERNTFTARSVVASLLLGTQPPRLPGAALVRAASALGCAPGTTRVALSRMVAAGELAASDGWYSLTGALAARQARQEEGRHPPVRAWDGTWVLAIVGGRGARSSGERGSVRRALIELRLAEWREGVWVRPDNLGTSGRSEDCSWVVGARIGSPPALWDVSGWAVVARGLLDSMSHPAPLTSSFAIAASVVRHLRDDPLLPAQLLPPDWPGPALRATYDEYERAFRAELRPLLGHPAVR